MMARRLRRRPTGASAAGVGESGMVLESIEGDTLRASRLLVPFMTMILEECSRAFTHRTRCD